MESTPSSGSETPTPLTRRTNPALADRTWLRSRRAHTFGLGALCGALGLSLLLVVTSISAASRDQPPVLPEPAPASDVRTTPRATPTPAVSHVTVSPPLTPDEATEAEAVADEDATEPAVEPVPAPVVSETPPAEEEEPAPGRSGSAPGHTKEPKTP